MKIAIVTGASSGLGREYVKCIVKTYTKLDEIWVVARRKERLEALATEVSIPLRIFDYDLKDENILRAFYEEIDAVNPDIKILVNAAGYGVYDDFADGEYNSQIGMVELNCRALTAICYMTLPHMSKKAKIVNVASAAAFLPQPKFAVYAATKSYVLSFSEALNMELVDRGISVIAVCPGPVKTEFFDKAYNKKSLPLLKRLSMASAPKVVAKSMNDLGLGKNISIYGLKMKFFKVLTKFLPTTVLLKASKKFFK